MEQLEHDLSHRFEADSVSRALALVGEKWTMLILREAFFGVRRYGQLARNLGIPRPTLSTRLRTLVDAGLLERVRYATEPDLYEYRLTGAGIPARSTPTGRYVTGSELVIDGGVSA
jgi:DNA-binding HxlR family transcriptional regulator